MNAKHRAMAVGLVPTGRPDSGRSGSIWFKRCVWICVGKADRRVKVIVCPQDRLWKPFQSFENPATAVHEHEVVPIEVVRHEPGPVSSINKPVPHSGRTIRSEKLS